MGIGITSRSFLDFFSFFFILFLMRCGSWRLCRCVNIFTSLRFDVYTFRVALFPWPMTVQMNVSVWNALPSNVAGVHLMVSTEGTNSVIYSVHPIQVGGGGEAGSVIHIPHSTFRNCVLASRQSTRYANLQVGVVPHSLTVLRSVLALSLALAGCTGFQSGVLVVSPFRGPNPIRWIWIWNGELYTTTTTVTTPRQPNKTPLAPRPITDLVSSRLVSPVPKTQRRKQTKHTTSYSIPLHSTLSPI